VWRGTDILKSSQNIMLSSGSLGPVHVFPSLLAKTTPQFAQEVAERRPDPQASLPCRIAGYLKQREFIFSRRHKVFGRGQQGHCCLKHPGRQCQVFFQDTGIPEGKQPLTVSFVGMPCTPFTNVGNKEGDGHPAIEAVNLCLADMSCSNMDLIGIEESDRFPVEKWTSVLPPQYLPVYMCFGSEDNDGNNMGKSITNAWDVSAGGSRYTSQVLLTRILTEPNFFS